MGGKVLDGRVVVVTGAGGGLGRSYALELARLGARVVVNDVGGDVHGRGGDGSPAEQVVREIRSAGGAAVADRTDVSASGAGDRIVAAALEAFGRLDAVVNNAGILRDRMLVNLEPDDWAAVMAVHLGGTYELTRAAARHWRDLSKAGEDVDARVVCVTSASGLYGNPGQANYAAAKAGIAGFVLTASQELARYGISVNALSPGALTRMTDGLFGMNEGDAWAPENVAPVVAWLLTPAAAGVTGLVIEAGNGQVGLALPWRHGPTADAVDGRWTTDAVTAVMPDLLAAYRRQVEDDT